MTEPEKEQEQEAYHYPDEEEETRISENFYQYVKVLFEQIKKKGSISLKELNALYEIKYGKDSLKNADYYSFLVHLCQKKEYCVAKLLQEQDTFLEGILSKKMTREDRERYQRLAFKVEKNSEEDVEVMTGCYVSDVVFERMEVEWNAEM